MLVGVLFVLVGVFDVGRCSVRVGLSCQMGASVARVEASVARVEASVARVGASVARWGPQLLEWRPQLLDGGLSCEI